ncbi:glycosyltransferase family A protein [Neobacillus niacini]|uniref:glycosyltransferase family A protein n=1 Tax=Neobacillus niacini TaxID=86668 RepID=UPI001C8E4013|nr:glycosyltransferase family 2 protein [Neobacillus niacini]MBY0145122.1 glycosyltransferase family 2 protein [Neobacillus niacini]
MNCKEITILTTTYNRGYIIENLYRSLCRQNNRNFSWLIVDDGSSDNTKMLVQGFIKENKIKIKYVYQNNGGKMRAHNKGVDMIETPLFMCVDSDDYLSDNAVDIIIRNWDKALDSKAWGMVAYKEVLGGMYLPSNNFPEENCYSNLTKLYESGFGADTSLVIRTDVMKENPFLVFNDEKVIPEGVVYDLLDTKYKLWVCPEILIICEYQEDGYTKNLFSIMEKNPKGFMLYYYNRFIYSKGFVKKFRSAVNVVCFYCFTRKRLYKLPLLYTILAYPLGFIRYLSRKVRLK